MTGCLHDGLQVPCPFDNHHGEILDVDATIRVILQLELPAATAEISTCSQAAAWDSWIKGPESLGQDAQLTTDSSSLTATD